MKNVLNIVICVAVIAISASCAKRELNTKVSNVTGWNYYDKNTTNFEALEGNQMGAPYGMVALESLDIWINVWWNK